MKKSQKIWLAISLSMFLIPELLWPQSTILIYFWIREVIFGVSLAVSEGANFDLLSFKMFPQLSGILILSKIIGLLASVIIFIFYYRNKNKIIWALFFVMFCLLIFANIFYVLFLINFNPQIG